MKMTVAERDLLTARILRQSTAFGTLLRQARDVSGLDLAEIVRRCRRERELARLSWLDARLTFTSHHIECWEKTTANKYGVPPGEAVICVLAKVLGAEEEPLQVAADRFGPPRLTREMARSFINIMSQPDPFTGKERVVKLGDK